MAANLLILLVLISVTVASSLAVRPELKLAAEDKEIPIEVKRQFVKQMMQDAYLEYERYALGFNELRPINQSGYSEPIFGEAKIGATVVDSLDTLFIMGLDEEYQRARDWVAKELNFDNVTAVMSVFQINIRFIGGMLSAYALTGDEMFKDKAYRLGKQMLPAFDSPTGMPYRYINFTTGEPQDRVKNIVLAEFGTFHMEFSYLSDITGDPIFKEKVDKIREVVKKANKPNGLYSNFMNVTTGEFVGDEISIGVMGDSFYEYLLKSYIQLGDTEARQMYDDAMDAIIASGLMKVSSPSNLLYFAERSNGEIRDKVGHLACFAGAMFALGSHVDPRPVGTPQRERDIEIGKNFTNTCHESYVRTATQIGPEAFWFTGDLEATTDQANETRYILRPEVVEAYFVLYRLTGEAKYREWGWDLVLAIQTHCKVGSGLGYAGLTDVYSEDSPKNDIQRSYFLAETLKYLYLLFSPEDLIPLDEWVFNTECHLLPVKGVNPQFHHI